MAAEDKFEQLLRRLATEDKPIPTARLSELSDLEIGRLEALHRTWGELSTKRRRALIAQLGDLADEQIELTFEGVNRFAMEDPDNEVRRIAIENLWESEDPHLVSPLLKALHEDRSPEVRFAAADALGSFALFGEISLLEPQSLRQLEDALLKAHVSDASPVVRRSSLVSLGYSSREEVAPLIQAAFDSEEDELVSAALLAMARSANDIWKPQVLSQLHSPSRSLREAAVRAVGEIELREAVTELIELLDDVEPRVRQAAIWSLSQLGGDEAREALIGLMDNRIDDLELELLEDALDNLVFVDGTIDLSLLDLDEYDDSTS